MEPRPIEVAGYPGIAVGPDPDGGRPRILWLHGITDTPEYCLPFLREFARAGYSSLALARRGRMGLPPAEARGVTFADFLEDSLRVFDAISPAPVVLGHSQGGLLALKLAELRRPPALLLLAPLPPRGIPAIPTHLGTIPASLASLGPILLGGTFRPTFRQASAMFFNGMERNLRRQVYAAGVPDSALSLRPAYLPGVPVDPRKVRAPLLCISGGLDHTIPAAAVARVARRYGGEWINFPNAAHEFLHEPSAPEVARTIADWLDRRLGR